MKKLVLVSLLLGLTLPALSQQFLWTTRKMDDIKVEFEKQVPLADVTDEVLKFYDAYKLYYDYSGFSKEEFLKDSKHGFDQLTWLKDIQELTVFAVRGNSGKGSYVLVMCVSKNNVNALMFSNSMISGGGDFVFTSDQEKFVRWFKTLLN